MSYQPIENYGIIGDRFTVALVGMDGSIDMLCLPRFDSPSVFAALVDEEKGGHFKLAPLLDGARHRQLYLPGTNVLLTRFLSDDGVSEISDFMPVSSHHHVHDLVRRAKTVRGELDYRMVCAPRFDYARVGHTVELRKKKREALFAPDKGKGMALKLVASVPLRIVNGDAVAEFRLKGGETASFVLEEVDPGDGGQAEREDYVSESFKETVNYWRSWLRGSNYEGRWRSMVDRSALTLKLLTSEQYGSIVAAPTFGLPEAIGGTRNWDYRYTWIRDASFTLYALIRLGFTEEAGAFMKWIEARCDELDPDGSLQIMYGIDGRHALPEKELSHLSGYMDSKPVRIGNGAYTQLQLDIYGELMDSIYLYDKYGQPISHALWKNVVRLLNWMTKNWRRKDEGIWEVRGGAKEFLFSRFMCWVALDRGVRLALKRSFPAPLDRWMKVRDEIHHTVFNDFWDGKRKAFVQHRGSKSLDASSLLMPLVRFISPTDPVWLSTLDAIGKELVDDSLVYRYRDEKENVDGIAGGEGTFSMCTFWYVECLSRAGDLEQARFFLEKMLGYANHLGLYSEELGPSGRHLGNFPQAFSHLAFISAAHHLDRSLTRQRGRS